MIGIALILASFFGAVWHGTGSDVSYGDYEGLMVRAPGNILLEVESSGQTPFSLYILTFDSVVKMIQQNGSMEGCTLLLALENITSYRGVLPVLVPGWYGVLVTPAEAGTISIEISVDKLKPSSGIFLLGLSLVVVGVLFVIPWSFLKQTIG
jgi:hypothetical protein